MQPSKRNGSLLIALVPLILLPPLAGPAQASECVTLDLVAKGVSLDAPRESTVDFETSVGGLEPLIQTVIQVRGTCVMAHFSALAQSWADHMIFQVSIDNVPMLGHTLFPHARLNDPPGLVVSNPGDTFPAASRMVAYDFVARVTPGWHVVIVRFAGCCQTLDGDTLVRAAVLTLEY